MRLFIYNKPLHEEVTERVYVPKEEDEEGNVTLKEDESVKVYPVTDLSAEDARGLVVYTDDPSQVDMLKAKLAAGEMEYHVDTDGKLTTPIIQSIRAGVKMPDGTMSPAVKISWTEQNAFILNIKPCSDQYLRDLCTAIGFNCTMLKRFRIDNLKVKKVPLREFEEYTEEEVEAFLAL